MSILVFLTIIQSRKDNTDTDHDDTVATDTDTDTKKDHDDTVVTELNQGKNISWAWRDFPNPLVAKLHLFMLK